MEGRGFNQTQSIDREKVPPQLKCARNRSEIQALTAMISARSKGRRAISLASKGGIDFHLRSVPFTLPAYATAYTDTVREMRQRPLERSIAATQSAKTDLFFVS